MPLSSLSAVLLLHFFFYFFIPDSIFLFWSFFGFISRLDFTFFVKPFIDFYFIGDFYRLPSSMSFIFILREIYSFCLFLREA